MRVLAAIPALLALSGTVAAAPATVARPSEAELKAILEGLGPLDITQHITPIPDSEILAPGVADVVFNRTSPNNGTLVSKRDYDEGGCFPWVYWADGNARQGYYNDFGYANAIFQSYDRYGFNWIGRKYSSKHFAFRASN
jgi:hypothetical protein